VGIREHDHEREEYMERVRKAGKADTEEETRHGIARYVLEKGTAAVRKMKQTLKIR
jgi:hypothetical protein